MRVLTLIAAFTLVGFGAQAGSAGQDDLLALVRSGKAAEAWARWEREPAGADRLRRGIALSAATAEVPRGLVLYRELVQSTGAAAPDALRPLAVAAARAFPPTTDKMLQVRACAVVVRDEPDERTCAQALGGILAAATPDEEAVMLAWLAASGVQPWPDRLASVSGLTTATRVRIATDIVGLSPAARVAVLAPLFRADLPEGGRIDAILALGTIPGVEAAAALTTLSGSKNLAPDEKMSVVLAQARHGDPAALKQLEQQGSPLGGPRQIDAAIALARVRSPRGGSPERLIEIAAPAARGRVAADLLDVAPVAARAAIQALIAEPTPLLSESGLRAAGAAGMGYDPEVFGRLADKEPRTRVAAIEAILQTMASPPPRGGTGR